MHPYLFILLDTLAFSTLIIFVGFFLYQDYSTPFGASRASVFLVVNGILAMFTMLGVLNFPIIGLMKVSVNLSTKLEKSPLMLKAFQREIIGTYENGLDDYFLHANIWDGQQFGVRDPIFGYFVDTFFYVWIMRFIMAVSVFVAVVVLFLIYTASIKSLARWRKAIPSVVCIGVVYPSSKEPNKLWRVGSGCIVSKKRGLVLTNWHVFQRMGNTLDPIMHHDKRTARYSSVNSFSPKYAQKDELE